MDCNQVRLRGNLGKDPVIYDSKPDQAPMAIFSIATNIRYKDKNGKDVERTEWHNCVCYDWRVDVARAFHQGNKIEVDGYLRTSKIATDKGDRTMTEIVVHDLHEVKLPPRTEQRSESEHASLNGNLPTPEPAPNLY